MAPPNAKPLWLAHIDKMASEIVPMTIPIDLDMLDIIKMMLLAPEDDADAVGRAVQEIRTYYRTRLFPPDDPFYRNLPDHGALHVLGPVVDHVMELSGVVSWREVGHRRLAELLVSLKRTAADRFDPENPELAWDSENLDWHAAEYWRRLNPNHDSPAAECTAALNKHVLLARLAAAGMFPADGPWRAADVISEGLRDPPPAEFAADSGRVRACRAAAAAHYLVVAGDYLSLAGRQRQQEQQKHGAAGDRAVSLRKEEWPAWAARLKKLAVEGAADAEDEWDLKGAAEKAADKVDDWLKSL